MSILSRVVARKVKQRRCHPDLPREARRRVQICVKFIYTYVRLVDRRAYPKSPKIWLHSGDNFAVSGPNSGSSGTSRIPAKMSALVVAAMYSSPVGPFKTTPAQRKPAA